MKFETNLYTDGNGYWSNVSQLVRTTKIEVSYFNKERDFGELRVYFNTALWDTKKNGLIYTDKTFLKQLKDELELIGLDAADVEYSEQGMQGNNYVSLDADKNFLDDFFKKDTVGC